MIVVWQTGTSNGQPLGFTAGWTWNYLSAEQPVALVAGPYTIAAGQVYVAGPAAAKVYLAGPAAAETYVAGAQAAQVVAP